MPSAHEAFDAEGSLRDPELQATLRGMLERLIDVAEQRSSPPARGARETAPELRAA